MTYPSRANSKLYEYHRLKDNREGRPRLVPTEPRRRKVQALARLGWSLTDMSNDFGITQQSLNKSLGRRMLKRETAEKIDAWYTEHELLEAPPSAWATRTRRKAEREKWPKPMDWDDIDAGILARKPPRKERRLNHDRFDEGEIEYVLQYHDWSRRLSVPEKIEIVRRWVASGRSERSLCLLTGWRPGRYIVREEVGRVDIRRGDLAT